MYASHSCGCINGIDTPYFGTNVENGSKPRCPCVPGHGKATKRSSLPNRVKYENTKSLYICGI